MACAHAKFTGEVGVCMATSGPGRDPPAERPLRREARPSAGGRDRRPAGADGARRQLPAGGRPDARCSRTSRTSTCTWRPTPAQIRHLVDRAMRIATAERTVTCVIVPNDVQSRRRSPSRRASTARCTRASATAPPRVVPAERRPRARRRGPQRRRAGRDARRRRRARTPADEVTRGRRAARRRRREGAARQGRAARRPAVRDRLDRAARHEAELGR